MQHFNELDEIVLCGGGARNGLLVQDLQALFGIKKIYFSEALGIGVDWVEAVAFAWLARQCINKKTGNLPNVTGAKGPRILGAIYQH